MEKLPNNLTFVRHGENIIDNNKQNTELQLSKTGIEQALWAGQILNDEHIDQTISSPTRRTLETVDIINKKVLPDIDVRLLERGWGDNTNGNETDKATYERAKDFLEEIKKRYNNKNVLVVTHGGLIKTIENIIEKNDLPDHKIENCSIINYSTIDDETGENAGYFRYKKNAEPYDSNIKSEILKKGVNAYLIRHGESESNRDSILAGSMDFPLTDNGIDQAKKVASKIASLELKFNYIFSSPLSRSLDTAKIVAKICGIPEEKIITLNDLIGCGGGDLEGKPYTEWYSVPTNKLVSEHGAESYTEQRHRIGMATLKILKTVESGENVLVVSHSSVFQVLQAINNNINDEVETFSQNKPNPGNYMVVKL